MSEEINFKSLILYLSAIALVLFFLIYMPHTTMVGMFAPTDPLLWLFYVSLVLGLLFPLYYASGQESFAWLLLGLALILNSIIVILLDAATYAGAGVMLLILGVLYLVTPFVEKMANWESLMKNVFHILRGLFIILSAALLHGGDFPSWIGDTSINHLMPHFIFLGGGLFVVFGFIIFGYGLFKLLGAQLGEGAAGKFFVQLGAIFYMLMVLVYLLGITFNVTYYPSFGVTGLPSPIQFFAEFATLGLSNLGAILLIVLYIYGMNKIVEKMEPKKEETTPSY